jgi:L-alanine-DL-glutamate epimerase-like enolase superfamily enzyme
MFEQGDNCFGVMSMRRRDFLKAMAGAAMTFRIAWANEIPKNLKITRAVGFQLESKRSKFAGKNSRRDVHGSKARDRIVRLYTNMGVDGIGFCKASRSQVALLLGKNPFDFYRREGRAMVGPLGAGTMPLWDVAGKVLGKPVYKLLGGRGARKVRVYDGSIYFSDLLPKYAGNYLDRFREEIDMGIAVGHRAFKVKIGRGAKWMPKEAGYIRDIEILKTIRKHVRPDVLIGVDANNGYDLARSKKLLHDLPDFNFAFVEEMFPETVNECLELKRFITRHGWKTLVADGESVKKVDEFKPYVSARAFDVLQGDMRHFGFEGIMAEATMARSKGLRIAPHNWGSLIAYYMQLHVGRAIPNFYLAEHDPLATPVLIAEGYKIKDGFATVPNSPGFGLKLDEAKFAKTVNVEFDLKA